MCSVLMFTLRMVFDIASHHTIGHRANGCNATSLRSASSYAAAPTVSMHPAPRPSPIAGRRSCAASSCTRGRRSLQPVTRTNGHAPRPSRLAALDGQCPRPGPPMEAPTTARPYCATLGGQRPLQSETCSPTPAAVGYSLGARIRQRVFLQPRPRPWLRPCLLHGESSPARMRQRTSALGSNRPCEPAPGTRRRLASLARRSST